VDKTSLQYSTEAIYVDSNELFHALLFIPRIFQGKVWRFGDMAVLKDLFEDI
jgi:hypothetical protein